MATIDNVRRYWDGNTNSSPNAKKLKSELEALGHTDIHVWWEPIGIAFEMCGHSGGYMCLTEQMADIEPLGLSFAEAVQHLKEGR